MIKLNSTTFAICIAIVLFCSSSASAQESVYSDKKALIKEIQDLTGMKDLSVKQEVSETNIGDALMLIMEKDKELTDAQKQELKKFIIEGKERIEKQIRDYTADKALAAQLFEEVFVQLYDKNFTEAELREMVVFYRTPTGQKSAKFTSNFINQIIKAYKQAFTQKMQDFASLIFKEEAERLKQKIQETKKPKSAT